MASDVSKRKDLVCDGYRRSPLSTVPRSASICEREANPCISQVVLSVWQPRVKGV